MVKVSIVTINFNDCNGLEATLKSVWEEQSYSNFEHIVIDGGSTDGSVDVIKRYTNRLAYWVSEPDKGIYNAMNKGVAKASGEYILFLNSGDWLGKDTLKEMFSLPFSEDIVSGDYTVVYNSSKQIITSNPDEVTLPWLMLKSLGHPSTLIKRELLLQNPYCEDYKIISDWAFWIEELIIKNRTYRHIPVNLSYFNFEGVSSNKENLKLIRNEKQNFFKKTFGERYDMEHIFDIVQSIDTISKHKSKEIASKPKQQRKLRQYYKLIQLLDKIF